MPIDALPSALPEGPEVPAGIDSKALFFGGSGFNFAAADGRVTVSAPKNVIHLPTGRQLFSGDIVVSYVDGIATFPALVPNDTPGLSRYDWNYRVRFEIRGAIEQPQSFQFRISAADPDTIDGDTLVAATTPVGEPIYLHALTLPEGGTDGQRLVKLGDTVAWASASSSDVTSVNGQTGAVVLGAADVGAQPAGSYATPGDLASGLAAKANTASLAPVATTGAYASLTGKPTIPATPADIGAQPAGDYATNSALTTGLADKQAAGTYATPSDVTTASTADRARANHTGTQAASTITGLATVATSGAYSDLSEKPTIPAAYTDDQVRDLIAANSNALSVGISTMPRTEAVTSTVQMGTSGSLRITYFTATRTITATQVRVATGTTAAAATPTMCKVGVYSVAGNGDLTLLAATASDAALFAAASTSYTRALTASATLTAGQRYALGIVITSPAALPTMVGQVPAINAGEAALSPALAALVSGQTDMPSSVPAGSLQFNTAQRFYGAFLP